MNLKEKNILMSWASFEDPESPGKFNTVTCSVKYKTTQSYGGTREVSSYYGSLPFSAGSSGTKNEYDKINAADLEVGGPWGPDT